MSLFSLRSKLRSRCWCQFLHQPHRQRTKQCVTKNKWGKQCESVRQIRKGTNAWTWVATFGPYGLCTTGHGSLTQSQRQREWNNQKSKQQRRFRTNGLGLKNVRADFGLPPTEFKSTLPRSCSFHLRRLSSSWTSAKTPWTPATESSEICTTPAS